MIAKLECFMGHPHVAPGQLNYWPIYSAVIPSLDDPLCATFKRFPLPFLEIPSSRFILIPRLLNFNSSLFSVILLLSLLAPILYLLYTSPLGISWGSIVINYGFSLLSGWYPVILVPWFPMWRKYQQFFTLKPVQMYKNRWSRTARGYCCSYLECWSKINHTQMT